MAEPWEGPGAPSPFYFYTKLKPEGAKKSFLETGTPFPTPLSQGLEPALISVTGDSSVLQPTFRDRLS